MGSPDCICDGTDFGDYAACGWKTVPEVYQAVHGNRSDSFYVVPVFRIFGTDTTGFMTEAEKKYTEMVEQIETKSAELEEEDVEKSLEESEEEQTEAGRIEVGEIRIGR